MKLHLPKRLLTALLAAFTAISLTTAPTVLTLGAVAWGGWGTTTGQWSDENTYYLDGDDKIKVSEGKATSSVPNTVFVKSNSTEDVATTVTSLTFDSDVNKKVIVTGDWNGDYNLTNLTITNVCVNVSGTNLEIGGNQAANHKQVVNINQISGSETLGTLTIQANSILTLGAEDNTSNTFTLGNVTNSGTLTLNGNTTATAGIRGSGELVVSNSSTLTFELSSNSQNINTNIRIKDGSKMEFLGNSYDNLNYGNNSRTIYLEGTGELALGNTRQTVGYWTFDMTGGTISGNGTSGKLDFHHNGTINVHTANGTAESPTISTISAAINTKDNGALTLSVDANAQLRLTNTLSLNRPTIKSGTGEAVMCGTVSMSNLDVQAGSLKLDGATATASGQITVASSASLLLSGAATLTISKTVQGDVTAVEGSTAKILINTNNIGSFNRALEGEFGDTGASGFWIGYQIYGAGSNAAVYSTTDTNTQLTLVNGVYGVTSTEFDVNDSVTYNAAQMSTATLFNVSSTGVLDIYSDNSSTANIANTGEVLIAGTSQLAKVTNSGNGVVYLLGEDGQQLLKFYGNFTGGTLSSSVDGNTVTSSTGGNFAGNITVLNGTTLKAQSSANVNAWECFGSNTLDRVIQVEGNATLDVNGVSNYYKVELQKGATLANDAVNDHTGNNDVKSHKQLPQITLTGDAEIRAISNFGMVGGGYDNTTLTLNSHTLKKTGTGEFIATNTTISEGTVQIDAGTFHSYTTSTGSTQNANLTAASFVVNQNGTFKVTGDNETVKNLTINGGSLATDAKTVTVSGNTVLNGGNLAGNLTAGNILFTSAMTQTGGTFTLNSSVKIDESMLASASGITLVDATGSAGASGFLAAGATGTLLTSTAGSVVLSEGLTTTLAGASTQLQFADGVLAYTTTARGFTFIVNEDLYYNATTMAGATGFYIAEGKTLSTIDSSAGTPVLSGSGIYNLGEVSGTSVPSLNATLGENWTGAVAVTTGNASFNLTQFNSNYTNANSKLKFTDFKGYIQDTYTVSHNLILENGNLGYGIRLMNGVSGGNPIITFSGSIEGTGNLLYSWPNANPDTKVTIIFNGDTSHWNGKVIRKILNNGSDTTEAAGGKPLYVSFTSGGNVFSSEGNGGVSDAQDRGMVHVLIDASDNKKTFFNGTLENINSLTVETDTQFNKNVSAQSIIANNATVSLADGMTLTLAANTNSSICSLRGANAALNLSGGTLTLGNGKNSCAHYIGTLQGSNATLNLSGGTLTLGGGEEDSPVAHSIGTLNAGTGSKLNLAENAVLNTITSVTSSITVTGSGTYHMASSGQTNLTGWTDSDHWTGTVVLNGMDLNGNTNGKKLSEFGNAESTVRLTNVTGWFYTTYDKNGNIYNGSQEYAFNIEMVNGSEGYAFKVTNGSSGHTTIFSGKVSGSGDLNYNLSGGSDSHIYKFTNDISEWRPDGVESPEIIVSATKTLSIILADNANTANVAFNKGTASGVLNLTVETTEAATFNNTVNVNSLTLNQSATFNNVLQAASASVAANKVLTLGGGTDAEPAAHSIGTLSAASAGVTLGNHTTLSLGGGTADAQVTHSIGTLSAASADVALGNYATLSLGGGTAEVPVTHSIGTMTGGTGSKLNLAENAVLNTIASASNITLTGRGVYVLGNTTDANVLGLKNEAWQGTVKVQNAGSSTTNIALTTALSNLGNSGSLVSITGNVIGYINTSDNGASSTLGVNICLEKGATLDINNGNSYESNKERWAVITGNISGEGNIATSMSWLGNHANNVNPSLLKYEFRGNIEDWTGNFVNTSKKSTTVEVIFSGEATEINADFFNSENKGTNSHLNLTIGKTADSYNVNGLVDVDNMTLGTSDTENGNIVINLNNNVTLSDTLTNYASTTLAKGKTISAATVSNSGTLKLGDTATISKAEGKDTASMHNVKLSEEGITSADETKATKGTVTDAKVTLAALAAGTSFSIEDVTLSNVNIEAANAGDRVNLSGLSASDVQLTKGEFHMLDKPQVGTGGTAINLVEGGPTGLDFSTSLLNGMTLGANASMVVDLGDLSGFTGMDSGKPTFSITLEGFSLRDYTGTGENKGLYFAADSWLGQLLVAQGAKQYVKGDTLEAGAQATAGTGSGVSVSYNSTAVGTVIIISGLQVPEPTTTSLSLLALSALAMRRRRK